MMHVFMTLAVLFVGCSLLYYVAGYLLIAKIMPFFEKRGNVTEPLVLEYSPVSTKSNMFFAKTVVMAVTFALPNGAHSQTSAVPANNIVIAG